jgi:type III pantothenate kinase
MLLTIDIGNTNIVFGFFNKEKLVSTFRLETRHNISRDEFFIFISPFLNRLKISEKDIKKIIVSSVVPKLRFELEKFCETYLNKKPIFVSDIKNKLGLKIKIDKPEELGADRVVNSIAALKIYKKTPLIIIDFGTATTFDVVNEKGEYIGGAISTGINLSLDALQKATAKLPKITIEKTSKIIGSDTISAMQSGIYNGYASLVEGMVNKISKELSKKPFVIATGGLASLFEDLKVIDVIDDELTLKGLRLI